jgi:hypothetical protein
MIQEALLQFHDRLAAGIIHRPICVFLPPAVSHYAKLRRTSSYEVHAAAIIRFGCGRRTLSGIPAMDYRRARSPPGSSNRLGGHDRRNEHSEQAILNRGIPGSAASNSYQQPRSAFRGIRANLDIRAGDCGRHDRRLSRRHSIPLAALAGDHRRSVRRESRADGGGVQTSSPTALRGSTGGCFTVGGSASQGTR